VIAHRSTEEAAGVLAHVSPDLANAADVPGLVTRSAATSRGEPRRLLFIISGLGGWKTLAVSLRRLLPSRSDVEARIVEFTNDQLPALWRWSAKRVRTRQGLRHFLPPIFRGEAWGREWLRQHWRDGTYDAVFVGTHHLAPAFAQELPAHVPLFVGLDYTFRRRVRLGPSLLAQRRGEAMEQRIFERAAGIFPLSHWAAASVIEDYGIPAERVHVVPPSHFLPDLTTRPQRGSGDLIAVGFVGNPFVAKGGEDLLAVHQRYFRDKVQIDLVSHGFRPQPHLRNARHVPFISQQHLLEEVMPGWDLFCLPTHHDMSSFATAEAHAAGLPAVTTRTGGVPEICVDGETGFIITPRDRVALADRLAQLIEDADLRARMGAAARRHAEQNLNAVINYNRLIDRMIGVL
jgi:glycosyltransferase involved in cell wall biosynthesis